MLVSELKSRISGMTERAVETKLSQLSIDEDASFITVASDGHTRAERFRFDEIAEIAFGKYLDIPKAYMGKCPNDLKAHNLNYWFTRNGNRSAVIEVVDDSFVTVHRPNLVVLPLREVVDVISNTMDGEYEVVNLARNSNKFQVDIITPHTVSVAPRTDIEDRNPEHHATVNDITHGGIRLLASPTEAVAPVISTYLHRLWCTNGATSPASESGITLKGNTVDDVLLEMEAAMQRVVGDLDNKLAEYASLAQKYPPGSKESFARQIGREYKIRPGVLNKIIDRVQLLPDGSSLYDIMQVFTAMANEENMPHTIVTRLQELGGTLAFDTEAVTHRCGTCERLLP